MFLVYLLKNNQLLLFSFLKYCFKKENNSKLKKKKILFITTSMNNSIISTHNFKKNYILSCGQLGFKGTKRATPYAAEVLGDKLGKLLKSQTSSAIQSIIVFEGQQNRKKNILKGLKKHLKLIKIIDKTHNSHNGCRSKKKRRL